jgi:hypothetical protein
LDDDRMGTAHLHAPYVDDDGLPAMILAHEFNIRPTASRNDVSTSRHEGASRDLEYGFS